MHLGPFCRRFESGIEGATEGAVQDTVDSPVWTLKDSVVRYETHGEGTCLSHHPVSGSSVISYLKVFDRNNGRDEFNGLLHIALYTKSHVSSQRLAVMLRHPSSMA
jgi:hypothetical protein